MDAILASLVVGIPTGTAGLLLGIAWDLFVVSRGWRGWHFPEITDEEIREWGLDRHS